MNNKIPLKKLADRLSVQSGVSSERALSFLKSLFQTIADRLYNGESVTISGLGTFSVSHNPEDPVHFMPEKQFADDINAPFAMFEPVTIDNDIELSEIEAVGTPTSVSDELVIAVEDTFTDNEPEPESTVAEPETVGNEMPASFSEPADSQAPEVTTVCTLNENADGATVVTSENESMSETVSDTEMAVLQHSETAETNIKISEETMPGSEPVVEPESDNDQERVDATSETLYPATEYEQTPADTNPEYGDDVSESSDTTAAMTDATEPSITYLPEDDEEYVEYNYPKKSRFGLGFLIGLITGLIIGALALVAYVVYFVNTGTKLFF